MLVWIARLWYVADQPGSWLRLGRNGQGMRRGVLRITGVLASYCTGCFGMFRVWSGISFLLDRWPIESLRPVDLATVSWYLLLVRLRADAEGKLPCSNVLAS